MLADFKTFIEKNKLCEPDHKILLAVSGGADSMVMAALFHRAGYAFAIAHADFGLRGKESEGDRKFVEQQAQNRFGVPFHSICFDTAKEAESRGLSIQETARELRYSWFSDLMNEHGYSKTATAHHLDDQAETFFINLIRGTGITGLEGIPLSQGNIIRPLLFCRRPDIEHFAAEIQIPYRSDSSNKDPKYLRNRIRHELLPLLEDMGPAFRNKLSETIEHLHDTGQIYRSALSKAKGILKIDHDKCIIPIKSLLGFRPVHTYLYELLRPFNFNKHVCGDIFQSLSSESGKQFLSPTHRLVTDRGMLVIVPVHDKNAHALPEILIEKSDHFIETPVGLVFEKIDYTPKYPLNQDSGIALLDLGKLQFPLTLRRWQKGDSFCPFGMNRRKKLSDFFRDEKMTMIEKEQTYLLCTGEKIVWVVGRRIDNRFRVTPRTTTIYRVAFTGV